MAILSNKDNLMQLYVTHCGSDRSCVAIIRDRYIYWFYVLPTVHGCSWWMKKSRSKSSVRVHQKRIGATFYAQHAHPLLWTIRRLITKSSSCASRTVSTRKVLILLPRSDPNQCRANGVKGTRVVKILVASGQPPNSTRLRQKLYMHGIGWLYLAAWSGGTRKQISLQSWRPGLTSKSAALPSRWRKDSPTATMMKRMMKITIRKRLTERGSGGLGERSIVQTRNCSEGTTGSCYDTVVANKFSTATKLGLHIVTCLFQYNVAQTAKYQLLFPSPSIQFLVITEFLECLQSGIPILKLVLFIQAWHYAASRLWSITTCSCAPRP